MLSVLASAAALSCMSTPMAGADLNPVGKAAFKKAFIYLYDASLCASDTPFSWTQNKDGEFSLALDYKRKFSSKQLVKATIVEMSRLSGQDKAVFASLKAPIAACFPDVKKGDQIIGVSLGENEAKFYYNGALSCEIKWDGFRENFFGIWLSDDTRMPKKSKRLRGVK